MNVSEKTILNKLQLLASKVGGRLFRNNVGMAWAGQVKRINPTTVLITNAVPIKYGLANSSGDLVGGLPVVITNDMVGKKVFVFTNYEVKMNTTRTTEEQTNFHNMVISLGGISIIERFTSDEIEGKKFNDIIDKFQRSISTS